MDGVDFSPASPDLVLQRFIVDRPANRRLLYWRAEEGQTNLNSSGDVDGRVGLSLAAKATLSFDTYFNSFFEAPWRRHTSLGTLKLRIEADGDFRIRVFRRALGRRDLVAEQVAGSGVTELRFVDEALNLRQHGTLSLEVTALKSPVTWHGAAWLAEKPTLAGKPVERRSSLGLVFCTFNRESEIGRVLRSIADDPEIMHGLGRVTVVNQGAKGLVAHPSLAGLQRRFGAKLQVIEQDNFGGAGGFTRGLLANLDDPAISHAVLLDDDIEVEPDSLLRMAAFFSLAKSDIVLGGHMLDSVQPTRLFEAGGVISDRHWTFQPQHHFCDLADPGRLEPLSQPYAVHYNGWWCCGIPMSVVRSAGLPMPCFIRGDDVELGLRLHQLGVPTVPLPGVAVWHEPFYLKLGSWQLYYETRNMLISAALHMPFVGRDVARRMARQFMVHLLTFRYYSAALILRGIDDFLRGPSVLDGAPQALHASLGVIRKRYPARVTSRHTVMQEHSAVANPTTRTGFIRLLAVLSFKDFMRPTQVAPPRLMPVERLMWTQMRGAEHVAIETWWDGNLPTYQRSREDFRSLAVPGLRTIWRLYRAGPRAAAAWRADHSRLVSVKFWKEYLKIGAAPSGRALTGPQLGVPQSGELQPVVPQKVFG